MEPPDSTHRKLLTFALLSLTPSNPNTLYLKNTQMIISHVETLGIVTSREHKPERFLRFTIDDGTGSIPCVLWLNQLTSPYFSRISPPSVRSIALMAKNFENVVRVGVLARVRGKIGVYRGKVQVTVNNVFVERDPNAEILHWLECMRLSRKCYDNVLEEKEKMIVD
uniref:CST complex subunit STN1 n=1 Tax=Erigeron canadensis TaxID=72917 RepID=UPI001CB98DBF|nr:CST complex subunit STN1 [Erigeron canadensis]